MFDSPPSGAGRGAQRWEMPVFNAPPPPPTPPPRTAAQLQDIEAAAHAEGYARGHADGLAAGTAEIRQQAQRLRDLLEHCTRPLAQLDAEVETVLVELALQAARRLVQQEFELDPARMAGSINEAIAALLTMPREVRVLLHPEDARLLKDSLVRPEELSAWRLVPDPSLARGDCRIAGDTGWVDATLATRERSLKQGLLGESGAAA